MTPSWYDVLGVEPDADTSEIRASWKDQVVDLDPTDRRFRMLNRAAEVLLDDERRAAHDRELADDEHDDLVDEVSRSSGAEQVGGVATPVDLRKSPATASNVEPTEGGRRPLLITAALGVVAVLLLIAAVISVAGRDDTTAPVSSDGLPDARSVAAARAAAEAAVVPVLSYDFRQLEQDKQAALSYMTPAYAAEYEQLFESVIAVNAPSTETVVSVEVLASGIVRTGPDLVDVLLFVNRPTVNKQQTTPEIYKDQATLRMRDVGGDWLVDCVISGSGSTCEG